MLRPKHARIRRKLYNRKTMLPTNQFDDDALQKVDNPLSVMQPGERVLCHITRHPFGLFGFYFIIALLIVASFVAAALIPSYATGMTSQDKVGLFLGALILSALLLIYLYVAVTIYKGNRWIVTSDSITQVTQTGLFKKHTSQLSLGNLEDVTYNQDGIIQSMFGFGTLRVETAGERSKFFFLFCPQPQQYARAIIQAHETYIAANPESGEHDNRGINVPQSGQDYQEAPSEDGFRHP